VAKDCIPSVAMSRDIKESYVPINHRARAQHRQ